jgi:acetyl esterase/lipase
MFNITAKFLLLLVINIVVDPTYSQDPKYKPLSTTLMEKEVYKTIGWTKLKLYIYRPSERNALEQLPSVVFFHGVGWGGGHAWQFEPQCQYLAKHGMVAMSVEYRVRKRQGATPFECVSDAKSAIRWVRAHAGFFNYNKGTNLDFLSTMEYTVKFLTSIGYIKGDTTIKK